MLITRRFIFLVFVLLNFSELESASEDNSPPSLPDLVLGSASAPIEIIMYFALDCTHCSHYEKIDLPQIQKKFIDTGVVRFIMREFPMGAAGLLANKIARCVSPSKFALAIQALFEKQTKWNVIDGYSQRLSHIAQDDLGLSEMDFASCMSNQSLEDAIVLRRLQAEKDHGITEVPAFFINGERYPHILTAEKLEEEIRKRKPEVLKDASAPSSQDH